MKKSFIIMALVVGLCSGCNKEKDEETAPVKLCKVRTFQRTITGIGAVETLSYDDKNRIIKIDNNGSPFIMFSYMADKIVVKFTTGAADLSYNLDASGRITSGNDYTYKYNAEGYLIESVKDYKTFFIRHTMTYENGNLAKVDQYASGPNQVSQVSYTYQYSSDSFTRAGEDSNPLTNDLNTIQPRELSVFLGKAAKNRLTRIASFNTGTASPTDFTYEKDANGNVTSVDIMVAGKLFRKNNVTYECQ